MSPDVIVWGNKGNVFLCFTMRELCEKGSEKGRVLSYIRLTC